MKSCIVFAYHNIGVVGIKALLKNNFNIIKVVTHKDNKNENIWFQSVNEFCLKKNIKCIYYEESNFDEISDYYKLKKIDFLFSFYFRNIFPKKILKIPIIGSINLHGSLLPKYRGAAPVNWQIINGERNGGVTLHYMNRYVDGGNIINQKKIFISNKETPLSLFKKIENQSRLLLNRELPLLNKNKNNFFTQKLKNTKIYKKRKPEDGRINWNNNIIDIYNLVRGVTYPYPGAFTYYKKLKIIIWSAEIKKINLKNKKFSNGSFYKNKKYLQVKTKDGVLIIKKMYNDLKIDLKKGKFR